MAKFSCVRNKAKPQPFFRLYFFARFRAIRGDRQITILLAIYMKNSKTVTKLGEVHSLEHPHQCLPRHRLDLVGGAHVPGQSGGAFGESGLGIWVEWPRRHLLHVLLGAAGALGALARLVVVLAIKMSKNVKKSAPFQNCNNWAIFDSVRKNTKTFL